MCKRKINLEKERDRNRERDKEKRKRKERKTGRLKRERSYGESWEESFFSLSLR